MSGKGTPIWRSNTAHLTTLRCILLSLFLNDLSLRRKCQTLSSGWNAFNLCHPICFPCMTSCKAGKRESWKLSDVVIVCFGYQVVVAYSFLFPICASPLKTCIVSSTLTVLRIGLESTTTPPPTPTSISWGQPGYCRRGKSSWSQTQD